MLLGVVVRSDGKRSLVKARFTTRGRLSRYGRRDGVRSWRMDRIAMVRRYQTRKQWLAAKDCSRHRSRQCRSVRHGDLAALSPNSKAQGIGVAFVGGEL